MVDVKKLLGLDDTNKRVKEYIVNMLTEGDVDDRIDANVPGMISEATANFLDQNEVDTRINTLGPGIADTEIQADVPGMIATAIAGKISVDEFVVGTATGRITFSNGLMMEWGTLNIVNPAAGSNTQAVTFTHSFAYVPMVSIQSNSAVSAQWTYTVSGSVSTTGFNAILVIQSGFTGTATLRWVAFGKRSGY